MFIRFRQGLTPRTSFPLKAGHPAAYLYVEDAEYRYIEKLDAPKVWFQNHAEAIMNSYGHQAKINKEDLFLSTSMFYFIPPDCHTHIQQLLVLSGRLDMA